LFDGCPKQFQDIYGIMIIVIMGVSGSGKSTVGKLLAERLSVRFLDGDDFHPEKNIAKMSRGVPLNDADRAPWLIAVSKALKNHEKDGVVCACSALKESYRQTLQKGLRKKITWMFLEGSKEILLKRIKSRAGHFMPGQLLQSQFDDLEIPAYAYCFSVNKSADVIVAEMIKIVEQVE
jgi:gluconokinase